MFILSCKLLIGHFVCDFALQNDFMAKAKNHRTAIPGIPFYWVLFAHAAIHAGAVWWVTGSEIAAVVELALHAAIDYAKCDGVFSFTMDQLAHALCKCAYAFSVAFFQ